MLNVVRVFCVFRGNKPTGREYLDRKEEILNSKPMILILLACLALTGLVKAQDPADAEPCSGPVYKGKEVSRKAKITSYTPPEMPDDRRAEEIEGEVILSVVACRTGKITNIEVKQGQPYGLTEEAIKAARKVTFIPAEKDGQVVSQSTIFHYRFDKN